MKVIQRITEILKKTKNWCKENKGKLKIIFTILIILVLFFGGFALGRYRRLTSYKSTIDSLENKLSSNIETLHKVQENNEFLNECIIALEKELKELKFISNDEILIVDKIYKLNEDTEMKLNSLSSSSDKIDDYLDKLESTNKILRDYYINVQKSMGVKK